MENLLKRGAEASIYLHRWFEEEAVFKIREIKRFRHTVLDSKIRGSRTLHEASFLAEARRLGIVTPLVYFVDKAKAEIVMQFIPGRRLKEAINRDAAGEAEKWCREVGRDIARLHRGGIIHGDLTTSNFIVAGDRLALIDFGLSFHSDRLEDRAVDIHLLNMIVKSAHSADADRVMTAALEGYREIAGREETGKVLKRLREIERRGRYKQVE